MTDSITCPDCELGALECICGDTVTLHVGKDVYDKPDEGGTPQTPGPLNGDKPPHRELGEDTCLAMPAKQDLRVEYKYETGMAYLTPGIKELPEGWGYVCCENIKEGKSHVESKGNMCCGKPMRGVPGHVVDMLKY